MSTLLSKKVKSWLALLVVIVFVFSNMLQLPVSAQNDSTGWTVDYSFDNTGGGYGVGSGGTYGEVYRYQTFTAPVSGTLKNVSLLINQKYTADGPFVSDLIVEIYNTEETGGNVLPFGDPLKTITIPKGNLSYEVPPQRMLEELLVEVNLKGVAKDTRYAVAVTQKDLVPWDAKGGNYLWPVSNVAAAKGEYFGSMNSDGLWLDGSNLGTGWLKVSLEEGDIQPPNLVIDYSFDNTGGGFGVGTGGTYGEVYRYQTFTAPISGTLKNVSLLINQKYTADGPFVSDLIVEIYNTEETGGNVLPFGDPLETIVVPKDNLRYGIPPGKMLEELLVEVNLKGVTKDTRYAVAVTQKDLVPWDAKGGNYLWPVSNVAAAKGEYFGSMNSDGLWLDGSSLGAGWLKVTISEKSDSEQKPVRVEVLPSPKEFIYIPIDETVHPVIKVYDQNGDEIIDYPIKWGVNKPNIVSIDTITGAITGTSSGKTIVTIIAGSIVSKLYVEVYDPVPHRISGNANISIKSGEAKALNYDVIDDMKSIRPELKNNIEFEIENSEIAVLENGIIKGIASGSTKMSVCYGSLIKHVNINVYSDSEGLVEPVPGMVIKGNIKFKPGEYIFTGSEGITIDADDIVIDGNGAVIKHKGGFAGTGIYLEGKNNVTIKNINIHGFNTGIHVNGGESIIIEYCDFSDNFNDPSAGWFADHEYGATKLTNMNNSTVRYNNGNNVWDGLNLEKSDRNNVYGNDFSVCGNVAMKLWGSSFNRIYDNIFSWGLRMDPGEVHARDSTSSLIEFSSHYNYVAYNDFTHGGDGIFIRPLHGASPIGNYFLENDTSWANNNAVESWSPGNVYVRNKANYSSYGFWLGGSDFTYLIENEVIYNGGSSGRGMQNAPMPFGNAGVSVVNNTSTNFLMMGNVIRYNNGPGIAVGNESSSVPAYHWLIQNNTISNNLNDPRGYNAHGFYASTASWVDIISNNIEDNGGERIKQDINSNNIFITGDNTALSMKNPPKANLNVTSAIMSTHKDMYFDLIPDEIKNAEYGFMDIRYISVEAGEEITFDASTSVDPQGLDLEYRWELGDGTIETGETVTHIYTKPGTYRGGMTVKNGELGDLIGFVVNVYDVGEEIGTEEDADKWDLVMPGGGSANILNFSDKLIEGEKAVKVEAKSGKDYKIIYPKNKKLDINLTEYDGMSFFIDTITEYGMNENDRLPLVRLKKDNNNYIEFIPTRSYMNYGPFAMYITEIRYSYHYMFINLNGDSEYFRRNVVGNLTLEEVNYLEFVAGPTHNGYSSIAIDSLKLLKLDSLEEEVRFSPNLSKTGQSPIYDFGIEGSNVDAPLINDTSKPPASLPKFTANGGNAFYGVEFTEDRFINRIETFFYYNPTEVGFENVVKPKAICIEYWEDGKWKPVQNPTFSPSKPTSNLNTITFDIVETKKVRVVPTVQEGKNFSIYGFKVFNTFNYIGNAIPDKNKERDAVSSIIVSSDIQKIGVLLNKKKVNFDDVIGNDITDLIVGLYNTDDKKITGAPLKTVRVPVNEVNSGSETVIDFSYEGLQLGKRYGVLLSQEIPGTQFSDGHYTWPTKSINLDEYFGCVLNISTGESYHQELGIGWLKVYMEDKVIDLSHDRTTGGLGVGYPTELARYQTFTIPSDYVYHTMDGSVSEDNIWSTADAAADEHWIEYDMGKVRNINTIQVYFAENSTHKLPENVSMEYYDGIKWNLLKNFIGEEVGKRIRFDSKDDILTGKIRISVVEEPGASTGIREIEIMKYSEKPDTDPIPDPDPDPTPKPNPDPKPISDTVLKETASITKEEIEQQLKSKGNMTIDTRYGSIIMPKDAYKAIGLMSGESLTVTIRLSNVNPDNILECYDVTLYAGDRKIESFEGNSILISILYDNKSNRQGETLVGAFIDEDGGIHIIPLSYYDKDQQKILISTNRAGKFGVKQNLKSFKDSSKHWAKDYISLLAAREIVTGYGKDVFAPDKAVTRAEFVKMLSGVVSAELSKYTNSEFTDVHADDWYTAAVAWAVGNNIAKGYGNDSFGPNDNITREQMATMVTNFAKAIQLRLAAVTDEISFADADKISDYAKVAVKTLQTSGIISGKGDNIFDPKGTATRAEAARVITEIINTIVHNN